MSSNFLSLTDIYKCISIYGIHFILFHIHFIINNAAEIPDINEEICDEILQFPHDIRSSTDKTFLFMKTEKILALTLG